MGTDTAPKEPAMKRLSPIKIPDNQRQSFFDSLAAAEFRKFEYNVIMAQGMWFPRETVVRRKDAASGEKVELGIELSHYPKPDSVPATYLDRGIIQVTPLNIVTMSLVKMFRNKQHFGMETPEEGHVYAAYIPASSIRTVEEMVSFHNRFARLIEALSSSLPAVDASGQFTTSDLPRVIGHFETSGLLRAFQAMELMDLLDERDMSKMSPKTVVSPIEDFPLKQTAQ